MLKHPNIVRLYDVIETDKYIGIILDYASGGELFDFILAHRYLKEKDACKLFAQLVSGVWYIHERKIVHRDLKLENLLLDRNRNVIITDFGFANRFEHKADDLMQTSCGSPCYAAPELVISEGSYVGSAVDIWSCGVILYAMLAGYLPFDDDPANPDGDNINLLYKYIVNTPLSFPDYISPEARDLLQIMLQPDPRRRASLRQVMDHPWLAPYAHLFLKTVEELEQIAVDLHKQKRMQYQRQMRAAHSSRKQQPEYLYEASPEPAQTSSRRAAASAIVMPSAPPSTHDDDPFAPGPGLLPQPVAESPVMENDTPRRAKGSEHPPATGGSTRGKRDVRHTIQVEYNQPEDEGQQQPQSRPGTATRSRTAPAPEPVATPTKHRRASQQGTPAPPPKDAQQPNPTVTIDHASPPPTPAPAVDISVSNTSSSAPVRQPSKSSSGGGSGRHRRGLSIDKIGLGKIFTSPSTERVEKQESASRRPSTLSVGPTPTTPSRNGGNFTRDASFTSTTTADSGRERNREKEKEREAVIPDKKSRRSTLSALANPLGTLGGTFRRSVTARTSAREAFAPQEQEKPQPPTSAPPSSYAPPVSSPGPGILTNGANNTLPPSSSLAVPGGAPAVPGSAQDAPASSTKARKVMQWFRTRSKGADELTDDGLSTHTAASRGFGASNTSVNQIPGSGYSTGPSASFLGASKTPKAPKTGGALRVHHGAVDQTTITSEAPPLVMARVRATLAALGIEAQDESEFKIRCVRPKRRANVAAVRMVGSAASGGVDRRTGLPVPGQGGQGSIVGSTGGMLRGLLGRRGSSQVVDDSADVSVRSFCCYDDGDGMLIT